MIRFIYGNDFSKGSTLARSMFQDRAAQFRDRLKWDVTVGADGLEKDQYDALNPMYVIWELPDGTHGGSMRIMPTLGRTMVNEHFTHLTGGVTIASPLIWECTRFCISPKAAAQGAQVAGGVMLAGHELGLRFGLESSVGVFDYRMRRIYKSIGWQPEIIGAEGQGRSKICVGLWPFSETIRAQIAANAGLSVDDGKRWFEASFPRETPAVAA